VNATTEASPALPAEVSSETIEDRRSSWPAALAALAEAAFTFIPLHALATQSATLTTGPLDSFWQLSMLYAVGVFVVTRLRRFKATLSVVAGAALVLGVAQALLWGHADIGGLTSLVVLLLFVALRVAMLGLRDWRDPMGEAFGVGVIALVLEIGFAGGDPDLRSMLPIAVVQFFVAALASRAASMRLGRPVSKDVPHGAQAARRWLRTTAVTLGALAGLLALSVGLGGRHGGLALIGRAVLRAVGAVFGFIVLVFARVLLGPVSWLVDKLNIDLSGFRKLTETLRQFGEQAEHGSGGGSDPIVRLIGLVILIAIGVLLFRGIRRHFRLLDRRAAEAAGEPPPAASLGPRPRRRRGPRVRRELPADTVRRWYSEALLMLERRGLVKAPSRTPAEYLVDVRAAYPECGPEFGALTRAYEHVRYGSRTFDPAALGRLEAQRTVLLGALHRAKRVDQSEGGDMTGEVGSR